MMVGLFKVNHSLTPSSVVVPPKKFLIKLYIHSIVSLTALSSDFYQNKLIYTYKSAV